MNELTKSINDSGKSVFASAFLISLLPIAAKAEGFPGLQTMQPHTLVQIKRFLYAVAMLVFLSGKSQ